jgi:hypothetical protein
MEKKAIHAGGNKSQLLLRPRQSFFSGSRNLRFFATTKIEAFGLGYGDLETMLHGGMKGQEAGILLIAKSIGEIRCSSERDSRKKIKGFTLTRILDLGPIGPVKAGNQRYVTGTHLHHDYGPERAAVALSQRPFCHCFGLRRFPSVP